MIASREVDLIYKPRPARNGGDRLGFRVGGKLEAWEEENVWITEHGLKNGAGAYRGSATRNTIEAYRITEAVQWDWANLAGVAARHQNVDGLAVRASQLAESICPQTAC